jgi:integrase
MSSIRQLKTGKWELTVRHPQLPKGRKFFTFADEDGARNYGKQWDLMVKAGLPLPASLAAPTADTGTLGTLLRARANNGAAITDQATLGLLIAEVGTVKLASFTYDWAERWVERMKVTQHLAPSSIRKRVGALSRAVDDHARRTPSLNLSNPLKLLPKRYSTYGERETRLLQAKDMKPKVDVERDRRLQPGEIERIDAALCGVKRDGRQRALELPHGQAMRVLFYVQIYAGLRLKEAYTLRTADVDLEAKIIRARKSKLWGNKVAYKSVPIQPALLPWLEQHEPVGELFFPFWDGDDRKATNRLSSAFARLFAYAQCEDLTEHDLRHEATCRWLELRNDQGWIFRLEEVNRIMGWAPNSKMAQRYASFRGEDLSSRLWSASPLRPGQ